MSCAISHPLLPSDCVTGIELSTRSSLISDCDDCVGGCSVGGVEVGAGAGAGVGVGSGRSLRFLGRKR